MLYVRKPCLSCNEIELEANFFELPRWEKSIGKEKILTFVTTEDSRQLFTFKKHYKIQSEVYKISMIPVSVAGSVNPMFYFAIAAENCNVLSAFRARRDQHPEVFLDSTKTKYL